MAYVPTLVGLDANVDSRLKSPDTAGLPSPITQLTMSFWLCADPAGVFRVRSFNSDDSVQSFALDFNPGFAVDISTQVDADATTQGLSSSFDLTDSPASNTLYHVLLSIDTDAQQVAVYVNDAALTPDPTSWINAGGLYNTAFHWELFSISGVVNGVGDFWVDNTFLDLSVTANRRKFINADLSAVDLGANGAGPTGSAPAVFLHTTTTASAIATNAGTGGAWSIVNGPLALDIDCVSFPAADTTLGFTLGNTAIGISDVFCVPTPCEEYDVTTVVNSFRARGGRTKC